MFMDHNRTPQFTATMVNDLYAINGTLLCNEEYTALTTRSLEVAVPDRNMAYAVHALGN